MVAVVYSETIKKDDVDIMCTTAKAEEFNKYFHTQF